MTILSLARFAAGAALAVALLAACSGGANEGPGSSIEPPNGREFGVTALSTQRLLALTMPHYHAGLIRPDRGRSWMKPGASKGGLLYIDDDGTNDVYVYTYPSGKLVGTLTGFDYPYGMCVDQKGDVYISNFDNGKLVEYAHGGTSPINTYTDSGGYVIGCSISAKGDVAATAFETSNGYGNVCIWKGGTGSPTCVGGSESANCYYVWTFGYDHKGDLIGEGEYSGIGVCEIPAGKTSIAKLSSAGITIDFGAGTQWDGKYIGLGAQNVNFETAIEPAKLSGSTLSAVGAPVTLANSCGPAYAEAENPFFSSNTTAIIASDTKRATRVSGPSYSCPDTPAIGFWKYPAGGNPILTIGSGLSEPEGDALSTVH